MDNLDINSLSIPKIRPTKAVLSFGQVRDFKNRGVGFNVLPDCEDHRRQLGDEEYLFSQTSRFFVDMGRFLTKMSVDYEVYGGTHPHEHSLVIEPVRYVVGPNLREDDLVLMKHIGESAVKILEVISADKPEFVDLTIDADVTKYHGHKKVKKSGG